MHSLITSVYTCSSHIICCHLHTHICTRTQEWSHFKATASLSLWKQQTAEGFRQQRSFAHCFPQVSLKWTKTESGQPSMLNRNVLQKLQASRDKNPSVCAWVLKSSQRVELPKLSKPPLPPANICHETLACELKLINVDECKHAHWCICNGFVHIQKANSQCVVTWPVWNTHHAAQSILPHTGNEGLWGENRGKWKGPAPAVARSRTQHTWLELPVLCHWATTAGQPPSLTIIYVYCTGGTECFSY